MNYIDAKYSSQKLIAILLFLFFAIPIQLKYKKGLQSNDVQNLSYSTFYFTNAAKFHDFINFTVIL